jgi:histidine triad (HIT) family protein
MNDCIFCKIVKKEIPAKIIYEDDQFLAFPDLNPVAKVHILLITKRHFSSIAELSADDQQLAGQLILAANKLARKLNIDQSGYRLVTNVKKDAGQSVDHLHLHIIGGEPLGPIA